MAKTEVHIYIKMEFHGNPRGHGGAAAMAECAYKGKLATRQDVAAVSCGTRNSLMLDICTVALRLLKRPCSVVFHTDNEYIKNCMEQGWAGRWAENGWKKPGGGVPANAGEWKAFMEEAGQHDIKWEGQSNKYDGILSRLAGEEADEVQRGAQDGAGGSTYRGDV